VFSQLLLRKGVILCMSDSVSLVFPHQLYAMHPALKQGRKVLLLEDDLFFTQLRFHKQKLLLHRCTMRAWREERVSEGFEVTPIAYDVYPGLRGLISDLAEKGVQSIYTCEPDDYLLERRLKASCKEHAIQLTLLPNPGFMVAPADFDRLSMPDKGYFMHRFYQNHRKASGILMQNGKPVGGKWSFDSDNRKKVPKGLLPPPPLLFRYPIWVEEEKNKIQQQFAHNPGQLERFNYPIDRTQALAALDDFLERKFGLFGSYEDAMLEKESYLWHSVLSPALNCGLLLPTEVVNKALLFAEENKIALNSLEGFIRQIIGWREFMRLVYRQKGNEIRNSNFFEHHNPMPASCYNGNTGMPPFDAMMKRLNETAYSHHIERLMVAGNLFLLCRIHPQAIYNWFMELYIDAYDWVMVPNVYSMSQYADGGLLTTKPYLSGSAYIRKMSDYQGGVWAEDWDALYWQFLRDKADLLAPNPRMGMMFSLLKKIDPAKLSRKVVITTNKD
jgi:deoxyribodipyrimidine photolyase-related protein